MIAVKKLDGSLMHLNEDLIERVEGAADGKSAVYLRDGGHIIVANEPALVVELIRSEKVALLRRIFGHSEEPEPNSPRDHLGSDITPLSQVRGL